MAESLIEHVSDTALWVATYRARETDRADALFKDPLAKVLTAGKGEAIADQMAMSKQVAWSVVIRTCIIDRYIEEAIAGGVDAIVNLGTGLDTRPYRMDLPSDLLWIEVDYRNIIEYKSGLLKNEKPRCRLERVSLDLANVESRRDFLATVNARVKKVLVLTEGVLPYLSNDAVESLAKDLRAQKNIAHWIVDYISPHAFQYLRRGMRVKQMKNAPFLFNPPEWNSFFKDAGWEVERMTYNAEEARRVSRFPPMPFIFKILGLLSSKKRRQAWEKMAGYALMRQI